MNYTLITGASSGIGYELALQFAKHGYNLILVARQENKLKHLAETLKKNFKVEALTVSIDLCQPNVAEEIYRLIRDKSININYLVNNAGFYVKGGFAETAWEDEENLIQLQCLTHTQLIKLFLPDMLKRGSGGLLIVASTGSFVPGPFNAAYCAAKSFVLSFSEALSEEVSGSGIKVTALCPGGTNTNFQDFSKRKKSVFFPIMEPSRVAATGYKALKKGKRVVIPGMANRIQVFLMRFIPRNFVSKLKASVAEK